MYECKACDKKFTNVRLFDAHRAGSFRTTSDGWNTFRRCLTERQLVTRGFQRDSKGYWCKGGDHEGERSNSHSGKDIMSTGLERAGFPLPARA